MRFEKQHHMGGIQKMREKKIRVAVIDASDAVKILLPAQRCSIRIAAGPPQSMQSCLNEAMRLLAEELELLCGNT